MPGSGGGLNRFIGPGLLLAGVSVGVSHLVQSTRAGAMYGFGLVVFILFALLAKYPIFRFGPWYAAATGTSLLEGLRRQGRWALALYLAYLIVSMFTAQAATTLITAALLQVTLGLSFSSSTIAQALLIGCAVILAFGRYRALEMIVRVLVVILTLSTLLAAALVIPKIDWAVSGQWLPASADRRTILFLAALVGWMPSAMDTAIWHSMWTIAKRRTTNYQPRVDEAKFDFHIGYCAAGLMALCFVVLGAGVMHGGGIAFEQSATGFAKQVIELYVATLGEWSRPLIGLAAAAVVFSTMFTVLDAHPRAIALVIARFRRAEDPQLEDPDLRRLYLLWMGILVVGSMLIVREFLGSLTALIDLATTTAFLGAPMIAWLIHRCVVTAPVEPAAAPPPWLIRASGASVAVLGLFAGGYLVLLLT